MRSLVLFALCLAPLFSGEAVTLRADSYAPFNGEPKAEHPGAIIEIAKLVFEKAGYTVDYQIMPWSRTIEAVAAGTIDGAVGAEPKGTPNLTFPAEAQAFWKPVFITPAGSAWAYAKPDSLADVAFGVVQDYDYGLDPAGNAYSDWIAAHPQKVRTLKGDKPNELAVAQLARKRLDVFIEDWSVILAAARAAEVDPAQLRNAGPAGAGYELFIGFTPNDRGRKLAQILAAGTAELRSNGQLAQILAAYAMTDWKR